MKNILIIGGSSGVGESLVKRLEANNNLISTYHKNPQGNSENVNFYEYDVISDSPSKIKIPEALDSIIYCPGTINLKPFNRYTEDELIDDFKINVLGFLKILSAFKRHLLNTDNPSIVLFSSVAAQKGIAYHTQVACSKGAIESLTKTLAAELAPKIRVNAIAPSLLNTPLANKFLNSELKIKNNIERHPLKKIGEANDISSMVEFLISDNAKWITGQVINIDGGLSTL
ncbi:MAG: SDR family NAD(P)-dependent oxidoreductase [Flavobacteriales bacterium]|nr:SDR family NAD(P)-dependent oxidoreductase [Flavobacteriales bacterium]